MVKEKLKMTLASDVLFKKVFFSEGSALLKMLQDILDIREDSGITIIGYETRGFLGNMMVVYPNKNLVIVRMISWESFLNGNGKEDGTGLNNFENFPSLTQNLIK